MANILKKEPGDIGKEELIAFLKNAMVGGAKNKKNGYGWGDSNFIKRLREFCRAHELPYDAFFLDPEKDKKNVIVRSDWKDYALALMLTYNENPYLLAEYDLTDKASVEKITNYHKTIIELVENHFSDDSKFSIMNTSQYQSMLDEDISMELAIGKMNELAVAMKMATSEVRGYIWKEIYSSADYLIYRILEIGVLLHVDKQKKNKGSEIAFAELLFKHIDEKMKDKIKNIDDIKKNWNEIIETLKGKPEYYHYLAQRLAQEDDDVLMGSCSNISELLAAKLRDQLECSLEADNIQVDENGKIYDVISGISPEMEQLRMAIKVLGKEANHEEIMAKHSDGQRNVAEEIKFIKELPQKIRTMEDAAREKIANLKEGREDKNDVHTIEFYEGFLSFAELIREEVNDKKDSSKNIFDAAILDGAYQHIKNKK